MCEEQRQTLRAVRDAAVAAKSHMDKQIMAEFSSGLHYCIKGCVILCFSFSFSGKRSAEEALDELTKTALFRLMVSKHLGPCGMLSWRPTLLWIS